MGASQLSREWISALIRPGATTTRVRVRQESLQLEMIEELTLQQLGEEARRQGSDPSRQLAHLLTLLTDVSSSPAGEYLLQHTPRTGAFCSLLSPHAGASHLDLHSQYTSIQAGDVEAESKVPIVMDPALLTPRHLVERRVPGTFLPKFDKPEVVQRGRGRGRGRGAGRGQGRGRGRRVRGRGDDQKEA